MWRNIFTCYIICNRLNLKTLFKPILKQKNLYFCFYLKFIYICFFLRNLFIFFYFLV
ncbi:hypothetical protein Mapa_018224 [Marchantia paleacea]|nr:hypothetical protein Mapa_018224 [Marchantia paleacea]